MKKDSRLSSVLHALLHMAERGEPLTSDELAMCMRTNPVVVRRTMGTWVNRRLRRRPTSAFRRPRRCRAAMRRAPMR